MPRATTVTVGGRDDTPQEGIQNNPVLGAKLEPEEIPVDDLLISSYLNAVGDETFWAFQAYVRARHGVKIAPPTILDGYFARIVGVPARFAMHSKQGFVFHSPLISGVDYRIDGELTDVYERRGIGFFEVRSSCVPVDDPTNVVMESIYTRAYKFPDNQYRRERARPKTSMGEWLYENGAVARAEFPDVGAIVEGRTNLLDQAKLNLYSGPESDIHTSNLRARQASLGSTSAQGLMASELESELYRDLFGLAFLKRGEMHVAYIEPIRSGVELRAVSVVEESSDELIKLRSAVATTEGLIVSVGRASCRHWLTDDDVAE